MPDIAGSIQAVLENVSAALVANIVIVALLVIFLGSLVCAKKGLWPSFVNYAPNLLTSLGILGTFAGIVIGLLGFDVSDIDGSIAPLLDGLMTAFLTSLAGMFLAIVFKSIESTGKLRPKDEPVLAHVGPEEIHAELRAQSQAIERLSHSIAGDEDSALISQIRLLRSDQRESLEKIGNIVQAARDLQKNQFDQFSRDLWTKLDEFAEMLSKSATEQVITALKDVVADFNRNLTEQFGDNFKKLNAAVEDLVKWQENYRAQLEQMNEQYQQGIQAITQTAQSVDQISEQTKQIPATMTELKTVMETANHQLQELERHLEAFRDMRDRAVEAVPQIRDQMDQMVQDVSAATKDAGEQILQASQATHNAIVEGAKDFEDRVNRTNEGLATASTALATNSDRMQEQLDTAIKDLNERVRTMLSEVTDGSKAIGDNLADANKRLETSIKEVQYQVTDSIESMQTGLERSIQQTLQSQSQEVARASQALNQELSNSVGRTSEAVNKQLDVLDKAMADEIERIMNDMGRALGSISQKIVEDYNKLAPLMSQVAEERRETGRN